MVKNIIIAHDYLEGSASSNRILCFAKGYREHGKNVLLMLYDPTGKQSLCMDGVKVRFFNEPQRGIKIFKRVIGILRYVKAIKKAYISEETVLHIYRTPWWGVFFNKKRYNFFFERGEIPFYSDTKSITYRFQEWLGVKVAPRAIGMLAQTYLLKEYYSQVGVKKIEVINMFVDVSRFSNLKVDRTEKYIAYCGTIAKHKDGVDDLIKAFEIVHKKHGDYKLLLIGAFEALYGDEVYVRNLVAELNLSDAVVFTGRVKPNEIPRLLANASILALARPENPQTKYGFPTKLGEYLCTGNPIVLTPVGEIGMYMKDHVNCVYAQPDNHEDFANKLLWVIEHYEEAKIIGEAGRALIDSDFSIRAQTQKAIDFMEKVSNPRI